MAIKYASEIIKEIELRGSISISTTSANGEEFEKWLYEEDNMNDFWCKKEKMINLDANEKEYGEFYGDAA